MNMLKCFLEIGAKPFLFDGLSFEEAKYRFIDIIGSEASRFSFLLNNDRIFSNEKENIL